MNVVDWSLHSVVMPLIRPARFGSELHATISLLILRISTGECTGVAEGVTHAGWTGVSTRSLRSSLEDIFLPRLASIELDGLVTPPELFADIPENTLAKGLVDIALWDLFAGRDAAIGRSPEHPNLVDVSWTVLRDSPARMANDAFTMVERHGFGTLKIKGGQGQALDVRVLREIRSAVGEGVTLYVDANNAYAAESTPSYARMLADLGVQMIEDPYPLAADRQFKAIQKQSPLPLIVDAGCSNARDAANFLARGAAYLSVKPGRYGFSESRNIACLSKKAGSNVHVGLFAETDLGSLHALRFGASLGKELMALPAEPTFFLNMRHALLRSELGVKSGSVTLPEARNVAALVDWDVVQDLAPQPH